MSTDRYVADRLLRHIHEATPGGIRREQFMPVRHPVKAAFAAFPFVAFVLLAIFAFVTRHH